MPSVCICLGIADWETLLHISRASDLSREARYLYFKFICLFFYCYVVVKHSRFHPQAHECHVVILSLGDPSLTHLRPSSTEVPAGVTPEPQSTSLSGKGRDVGNFLRTPIPCDHAGPREPLRFLDQPLEFHGQLKQQDTLFININVILASFSLLNHFLF